MHNRDIFFLILFLYEGMLCVLIRIASYHFQSKKENHPKLS